MEIGLVILLVLAILVVALVLRKKKAAGTSDLTDASSGRPQRAIQPPGIPASQQTGRTPAQVRREEPAAQAPSTARVDPDAWDESVSLDDVGPAPAGQAPTGGADADLEPAGAAEQPAASPPPAPVRTPATPAARTAIPSDAGATDRAGATDAEVADELAADLPLVPRPSARVESSARGPTRGKSFLGLRQGLAKSRESTGFFGRLKQLLGGRRELDGDIAERIEEILLGSDVGVATTERMLGRLKEGLSRGELGDEARVLEALRNEAERTLAVGGLTGGIEVRHQPTVVLFVGVNGAGKTTTIGKLAQHLTGQGKKVMLAAGDTFRAAAVDQLKVWGRRVNCEVVTGKEGADPSSVLFDAIQAAKAARVDVLLADTAGRLHTKTNLMQEMTKVQKVAAKALEGAPHETLLVIDSTNGQNALAQAREFKEALPVTGLVLTKLDGTAKGGVVLGICDALRIPVRYVGVGERAEDLHEFDPSAFVEALLGAENEVIAA